MAFAHSQLLIPLAVLVLGGLAALVSAERRRRADLARFGEIPLLERATVLPAAAGRVAAWGLALVGLALLGVALARPQFGARPIVLSRTGRDVVFALDLSRSMNAEDVPPSRLTAAKQAARELLEASPGDRVGLVVFGGSALLQVPLTLDRAAFDLFLGAASTGDVSDPGTNLPAALAAAGSAFGEDSEPSYRVVVLLSDGESLEGDPGRAAQALREEGVRVFTVGIGTPEGAPIPERVGSRLSGYHRDANGEVVVTRLEEDGLRRVAAETGGSYVRLGGGSMRRLATELAGLEKREISSRTFTQLVDRYQLPLALALAALFLESLIQTPPAGRPRRPSVAAAGWLLVTALVAPAATAQEASADAAHTEAERLYRRGRFQEAYDEFRRLAEEGEPSAVLSYDMGNALYRLGRYDAAVGSYREALAESSAVRQPGAFNLGNALYKGAESEPSRREDLRRAVSAYEQALVLAPRDADAKWNLELALRKLEEESPPETGGGGGEGGGGGGGGEDDERDEPVEQGPRPGPGGGAGAEPESPDPSQDDQAQGGEATPETALTPEQARQLLEAIQSEEGEVLSQRQRGRARAGAEGRDW